MTTRPSGGPLSGEAVAALEDGIRGETILPDDGYEEARAVWNAAVDRYPAVAVRPLGAADVMAAVRFAREHDLEIAVKGGSHNVVGNAVCDDGPVIDCSRMTSVRVDPDRQTARVEPGAVLHDLDVETQAHGLVTPAGFVSTTGVAGLTLGGGIGYLSRAYGLTVDNLRSVDLVTADGEFVRASDDENPGLFWGLRGGGGNFGVVTSFEDAPSVLRRMAAIVREAPDEVSCLPVLRHAPSAPFLPESVHGELVLVIAMIYAGDPDEGAAALAPLCGIGTPVADAVRPQPYVDFQSTFDAASGPGAHNYWKSHYFADLADGAIDALCEHAARMTSPESAIGMLSLGGAVSRTPAEATAYPHRDAAWVVNVQSRWHDPGEKQRHVGWTRELFDALVPFSTGGVYVNFVGDEGRERVRAAYGDEIYGRLREVKAEWDPEDVFHLDQNVEPAN